MLRNYRIKAAKPGGRQAVLNSTPRADLAPQAIQKDVDRYVWVAVHMLFHSETLAEPQVTFDASA
jgi:hypothetical protein